MLSVRKKKAKPKGVKKRKHFTCRVCKKEAYYEKVRPESYLTSKPKKIKIQKRLFTCKEGKHYRVCFACKYAFIPE